MNDIGNVANFQSDAHMKYDGLRWGIEAQEEGENVCDWNSLHVMHFHS